MRLTEEGLDPTDMGSFDGLQRVIRIRPSLHRAAQMQVLKHEWIHAVLWDSGVSHALTEASEEAVCDAIATALTAEHFN